MNTSTSKSSKGNYELVVLWGDEIFSHGEDKLEEIIEWVDAYKDQASKDKSITARIWCLKTKSFYRVDLRKGSPWLTL